MRTNLLITAAPGAGKTTVLRRVVEALASPLVRGFLTDEIRERGQRVGFRIQTLDGRTATLSHVHLHASHRVGRYSVDVGVLDQIVGSTLIPDAGTMAFIIDEIGKMECLSPRFASAVAQLLEGDAPVVATVALRGGGFIAEVKARLDVETWEVTRANRDSLPAAILRWLTERGVPPSG